MNGLRSDCAPESFPITLTIRHGRACQAKWGLPDLDHQTVRNAGKPEMTCHPRLASRKKRRGCAGRARACRVERPCRKTWMQAQGSTRPGMTENQFSVIGKRSTHPIPLFSSMKPTMSARPLPVRRLLNTNGRVPRMRLASRSITSSEAPTCGARSILLIHHEIGTRDPGPPFDGLSPAATSMT